MRTRIRSRSTCLVFYCKTNSRDKMWLWSELKNGRIKNWMYSNSGYHTTFIQPVPCCRLRRCSYQTSRDCNEWKFYIDHMIDYDHHQFQPVPTLDLVCSAGPLGLRCGWVKGRLFLGGTVKCWTVSPKLPELARYRLFL